jgi:hypothetical protein
MLELLPDGFVHRTVDFIAKMLNSHHIELSEVDVGRDHKIRSKKRRDGLAKAHKSQENVTSQDKVVQVTNDDDDEMMLIKNDENSDSDK